MKTITKYISITLLSATLFASCSDEFLQRNSPNEPSSETIWADPQGAFTAMLAACYDALQSNQLYNGSPWAFGPLNMDCMTDNGGHFNWSGWMEGYDFPMGIQNPSSLLVGDYWKACYEVINRCNNLLVNSEKVHDETVAIYSAEAKVLRALMYINLTMTYQDVPFLTKPLTLQNPDSEKTSRSIIVSEIMKDLKEAAAILPATTTTRGRLTKGAAYALLGRLALYNEKWEEAIAAYKEVMKQGYSLHSNYAKLFTPDGETSSEIILGIRYEGPGNSEGSEFGAHWNTPLEAMNGTINLADEFYSLDGKPTKDMNYGKLNESGGLDVAKPNPERYKNRDPRLYATLFVPGMSWNGVVGSNYSGGASASLSTIYVKKYFNDLDTKNSWDSGQDFYLIRYAEVLVSMAEALVQKGGYSYSEVTGLINQLRQRVGMPSVESVEGTSLSKEALLEVVKHERRVELAFEGLRLFDLYRWKEWEKSIQSIEKERITLKLQYEPRKSLGARDYVWPLPTGELDTNKKLIQNELWK